MSKNKMGISNSEGKVDNQLLFSQWLGRRYVKKTCGKYEECIDDIDIRALKIEGLSLLTAQTPQLAVAIVRKLESKALLNKEEKKASVLYLSFLTQKKEVSESEASQGKEKVGFISNGSLLLPASISFILPFAIMSGRFSAFV